MYSVFKICSLSQNVDKIIEKSVRLEHRAPMAAAGMSIVKAWKLAMVAKMYQIAIWKTVQRYSGKSLNSVSEKVLPLAGIKLLPDKMVAGKKTRTWKIDLNASVSIASKGFSCNDSSFTHTDWTP